MEAVQLIDYKQFIQFIVVQRVHISSRVACQEDILSHSCIKVRHSTIFSIKIFCFVFFKNAIKLSLAIDEIFPMLLLFYRCVSGNIEI